MNNIITMLPVTCARFNNTEYKFCLPPKINCDDYVPQGLLTFCGQEWNCNEVCNGFPYHIPAVGKITFQTSIKSNSEPAVTVIDLNGGSTSAPVTSMSVKKQTVWYQTVEVNTDAILLDCFQIKITVGENVVCSQWFKKVKCSSTVSFESIHGGKDCLGQLYGNTGFSNKIHLEGMLSYYGGSVDEEGVPTEVYRFTPSKKIAPFMMKYLLNVVLAGKKILVNDEEYLLEGTGALTPLRSGMFFPVLEFSRVCNNNKTSCDN